MVVIFHDSSSVSAGVVLVLAMIDSSIFKPLLKKMIPPIILKASIDIEYNANTYDPKYANVIKTINPVSTPFFAIVFCSLSENLSVKVKKIGAIPIGLIKVNKVDKQSNK